MMAKSTPHAVTVAGSASVAPVLQLRDTPRAVPPAPSTPSPTSTRTAKKAVTYDALIWVTPPPAASSKRARKKIGTKKSSENHSTYGPATLSTTLSYKTFLSTLATRVQTDPDRMALDSIMYRFEVPANSPWKPVRDDEGYDSLINQVRIKSKNFNIIVRMDSPATLARASTVPVDEFEDSEDELDAKRRKVSVFIYVTVYLSTECYDAAYV